MIQSRCFRLVVQIQRRADKIHQLDAERLSALTPAVLEGFRMRNYTVLSLIQLSKSIGNQGLAKAIPQERIKTTCMVLSRVAGGRSILGYCELRIIWLSDNIINSGPQPLTDVSREYLEFSAIMSPGRRGLPLPRMKKIRVICLTDLST